MLCVLQRIQPVSVGVNKMQINLKIIRMAVNEEGSPGVCRNTIKNENMTYML